MRRALSIGLLLTALAASAAPPAITVSPAELRQRLTRGEPLLLIDCRARRDYQAKHIPGAVSIPIFELGFLPLPRDKDLVVYCAGTSCGLSSHAVRTLKDLGYARVLILAEGLAGWEAGGYPVEAARKPESIGRGKKP